MKFNSTIILILSILYNINASSKKELFDKLVNSQLDKVTLNQDDINFIKTQGIPIQIRKDGMVDLTNNPLSNNFNSKDNIKANRETKPDLTNLNIIEDTLLKSKDLDIQKNKNTINEKKSMTTYPINNQLKDESSHKLPITTSSINQISNDIGDTCLIGGMKDKLCKGFCPRCWVYHKSNTSIKAACYDYSFGTKRCPFDNMIDRGNDKPPNTKEFFKGKSCFIGGNKKNSCTYGDINCPVCWVIDYKTQEFDCYQKNIGLGKCDLWEGMTDITRLV